MILALALGVAMSNGTTARVEVSHPGTPISVEIVALDQNDRELPAKALPQRLTVGHNNTRTVRVLIPDNASALCAVYSSPSARVLSCSAQLNKRKQTSTRNASKAAGFPSILRRALDAHRQKGIEPRFQLSVQRPDLGTQMTDVSLR